ncbi:MAG: hypothetical protein H7Z37_16665 [Pyrinomonadaceae bacterium]|nr:hypothetical protein [Pyrinomonadaceae bacterium]
MNEIIILTQLCLFVVALVATFYYVASAVVNFLTCIFMIVGYTKGGSALPFVPSVTGVVAGVIVSLYFGWLPLWLAMTLAILPDASLLFCGLLGAVILIFRMMIGLAPKDDDF